MKNPKSERRGALAPPPPKGVFPSFLIEEQKRLALVCIAFVTSAGMLLLLHGLREDSIPGFMRGVWNYDHSSTSPAISHSNSTSQASNLPTRSNFLLDNSGSYEQTVRTLLKLNGTIACHNQTTNFTRLENLPKVSKGRYLFRTDTKYLLTLVAYQEDGERRCSGGDFYEVDFHNDHYRSRLPTIDYGNGTYGLELMVPSRWAGTFTLQIWLLFPNWHGMDIFGDAFALQQVFVETELDVMLPPRSDNDRMKLAQCTKEDFDLGVWSGRWTRSYFNEACEADDQKRFKCVPPEHWQCEKPWCLGPVGRLESNGWSYSAHCSFKIFEREEAWQCLDGKWFLMWGDSNFQDTIRNLVLFILEWDLPGRANLADYQLERSYETYFINPHRLDQRLQVSSIFNGANDVNANGEGWHTMNHEEHQQKILAHFNGERWPDTIIMNSGLHDGYREYDDITAAADFALDWWRKLYKRIPEDRKPVLIWRTTVAPAGNSRPMPSNPNKMEIYNHVLVEKFKKISHEMPVKFVDGFDLTFPFHYDNSYSDGGHYGRAPGVNLSPWYRQPHWYFVDVMLAHIWLNAIC